MLAPEEWFHLCFWASLIPLTLLFSGPTLLSWFQKKLLAQHSESYQSYKTWEAPLLHTLWAISTITLKLNPATSGAKFFSSLLLSCHLGAIAYSCTMTIYIKNRLNLITKSYLKVYLAIK